MIDETRTEAPATPPAPTPAPAVPIASRKTRLLQAKAAVSEGTDLLRAKAKSLKEAIGEVVKNPGDPETEANADTLFREFMTQQGELHADIINLQSLKDAGE